jgi:PPOX class probable F420-dependent enzyme
MSDADPRLLALAADHDLGVLVTLKRDGRPQLSNVSYVFDPETMTARVSVTDDRAKTRNARRDPRVSLFVSSKDGWSYAALDGDAELSDVTIDPHDAAADALVAVYRDIRGEEHPDWDEYRGAMVEQKRLVRSLQVTHVYGAPPRG